MLALVPLILGGEAGDDDYINAHRCNGLVNAELTLRLLRICVFTPSIEETIAI